MSEIVHTIISKIRKVKKKLGIDLTMEIKKNNKMTSTKLEKIQKINLLLAELHDEIPRTDTERKIIYSIRGILGQMQQYWEGDYYDIDYVTEKCNLIRIESLGIKN